MRTLLLLAVLLASGCEQCGCESCAQWRAEKHAERERLVEEHRHKRCQHDMDVMTTVVIPSAF